jgi:regulator of nucleoside diphosphate kinase
MKTKRRQIYITDTDNKQLRALLASQDSKDGNHKQWLNNLKIELNNAFVVASKDIPKNVITMHSQVLLTDLNNSETIVCTLVFPSNSDFEKNRISILAPVGAALIGRKPKEIIDLHTPGGQMRLRIDAILFQPELAGEIHL